MKSKFFLLLCLIGLTQLCSCVIMYPPAIQEQQHSQTVSNDKITLSLEVFLARFPIGSNDVSRNNSLYVTVINYKEELIAEIQLLDDTVDRYRRGDSISFKVDIRSFDKTRKYTTVLKCSESLFQGLNVVTADNGYYRLTSSARADTGESCLVKVSTLEGDKSDLFYTFSGEMISNTGSQVSYWGQSDVVAGKVIYGAVIKASNEIDNVAEVVDFCRSKIENAVANADCKRPEIYLTYYTSPLFQLFYKRIKDGFFKDCTISRVKCTEKKK